MVVKKVNVVHGNMIQFLGYKKKGLFHRYHEFKVPKNTPKESHHIKEFFNKHTDKVLIGTAIALAFAAGVLVSKVVKPVNDFMQQKPHIENLMK